MSARSVEARKNVTATTPMAVAGVNAFAGRLQPIEEPRLILSGESVVFDAFIEAPHDRRLTTATRFWDTSGFSVSLGASGLSLNVGNLAALVTGGIAFDTVFSMGVLYHRRDPILFLEQLKQQLRPGGELVLETLVVDGDEQTVMMAGDRYAQMRNVWFLPSVPALSLWLSRLGFENIRCVDISVTSIDEQRRTSWMTTHSLADFLDPDDHSKTIEGYPAPKRAVLLAQRKA
jgi:tRNA (mo5U34)-methyltransferase